MTMIREFEHHVQVKVDICKLNELGSWCDQNLNILHAIPSQRTWDYKLAHSYSTYCVFDFYFQDASDATFLKLSWS